MAKEDDIGLPRVKVTEVEIPKKGLKSRALNRLANPDHYNFEFQGGLKIEFPNGTKYNLWCFNPPGNSYTWFEMETVAQKAFNDIARKRGLKVPEIVSVGIEGRALVVLESLAHKRDEGSSG